jgi:hypothetical protein
MMSAEIMTIRIINHSINISLNSLFCQNRINYSELNV